MLPAGREPFSVEAVREGIAARRIQTGVGPLEVKQPRVNDKRIGEDGRRIRFSSKILPAYLRRTKSIDELIPWLYLKGISSGDFTEALQALLGPEAGLIGNQHCSSQGVLAAGMGRLVEAFAGG